MEKINYKILKIMAFAVVILFMSSSVFAQVQETQQDTTAQDTATQMNDQQQVMPQEQNQQTGEDMQSQHPDKGVDYSATIEQSELPQEVSSSLDELYPAHKVVEVFRGGDDSYKVKVKNETDEAVVYYDSEGKFLRAENLSGLNQEGALPQEQGQRTQESQDQDQWGTDDEKNQHGIQQDTVGYQQDDQQDDKGTSEDQWGTQDDDQDAGMQGEESGAAVPQEQNQRADDQLRSQDFDKGVNYSESIQESNLPQDVTSSLDELYPAHTIENIHKGDDDSYKVKVKNEDDVAVVYYDAQGNFLRAQNISNMHQEASSQEQSQRASDTDDFDSWDADDDNQISEEEFSDGLFSQGKNDAGLFDDDDKDSKGLSEIGAEGKNDSGIFDSDDKDSKGLSEIGSDVGYDDDTFYETSYDWWDANDDQQLDETEWDLGYENSFGDYLDDDFDAYDTNQDNYLSYDEYYDSVYETDYFSDWDNNDDDVLDNEEYSAGLFDTWDANDDNSIDENEYNDLSLLVIDLRAQQNQGTAYPQEQSQRRDVKDDQQQASPQEGNQRIENVEESQDADRWGTENRMPESESDTTTIETQQDEWEMQSDSLNDEGSTHPQEQQQEIEGVQDEEELEDNWGTEDTGAHQSTWMGGEGTDTTQTPSRIDTTAVYKNQWEEGTFEEGEDDVASPQEQNQQTEEWGETDTTEYETTPVDTTGTFDDQMMEDNTLDNDDAAFPQEQNQQATEWEDTDTTDTQDEFNTTPVDTTDTYNDQMMEDNTLDKDDTASPQEQYQATGDEDVDYSEEVQESELPETVTNSLDELYPDYEIEEAFRGDDGSYKVKLKKDEEKVAVYYDSEGLFYRDEVLDDMLEDTNKDTNQDW